MKSGKYRLAEIFQDGMMLQRDKRITIWGQAAPGIHITAGLYQDGVSDAVSYGYCTAEDSGRFSIALPSHAAGKGFALSVRFDPACGNAAATAADTDEAAADTSGTAIDINNTDGKETIAIKHICFGDIWLAGGQSNMEFFLKYDRDWEHTKRLPHNPDILMYNVPQRAFAGHTTHNPSGYGYWFDDRDGGLETFSAPAYSFARSIQEATGVPVGVIGCNWGGTTASAWIPEEALQSPPLDLYLREYRAAVAGTEPEELAVKSLSAWEFEDSRQHREDFEPLMYGRNRDWQLTYIKTHAGDPIVPMGPYNINRPSGLYHTMLAGLIPFSIKGVLWYQGESDAGCHAFLYDRLLTSLIQDWRMEWDDPFPFLIVQLAPFGVWLECNSQEYALVREKQAYVADHVPEVYMAGTMDLGSYYDIHPKEKMEVGRRLSLLARGHIYGENDLLCDAPRAVRAVLRRGMKHDADRIVITFLNATGGLTSESRKSDWNLSAGNQNYEPAGIDIQGDSLILTLPDALKDSADRITVSLGWKDYAVIYIYNRAGLSALPFQLTVTEEDI